MASKNIEVKVGLVIILGVLILALGIIWVKGYRFRRERHELPVHFKNVMGLKVGDPVTIAGVKKGKVKAISLQSKDVVVTLLLDKDVELYSDTRITIRDQGLMGQKLINIDPGESGVEISPPIYGAYRGGLSEALDRIGVLAAQLEGSIGSESFRQSIQQSLTNTRELTRTIKTVVDENKGDFTQAVQDFKITSRELRNLVGNREEGVGLTVSRLNRSTERFERVLDRLEEASNSFSTISKKIDNGQGTLGMLVNDKELYQDLRKLTKDMDALIKAIKENPEKHLKVKVEMF